MKTRDELAAEGVLLDGPIVPEWFKLQSDGCSVPTRLGRFFLRARQSRAGCYIHDFEYWLIALEWVAHSPEWVGARMAADYRLKQNRKLVARNKAIGWIYSRLWFRGVRVGGRSAVRASYELAVPPTLGAVLEIETYLSRPITTQARRQLEAWKREHGLLDLSGRARRPLRRS